MKIGEKEHTIRAGVIGCKHTTREFIVGLLRAGIIPDHCITIPPQIGITQQVAGYLDLLPFLEEREIPYTVTDTYNLKGERAQELLQALQLDLLLVIGWQRLIPEWWLRELRIGAFGMHGSSKPLPHGRGRSPLNWSIIQGKSIFYTHLFRYLPGVDDGPVVGVQTFDITPLDTCLTLHFKNTISMIRLCVQALPQLIAGTAQLQPQPNTGASYYPKRSAEDGLIFWEDSTADIYNLIRAVTKPFPGAFTYFNNEPSKKITIWQAQPFDSQLNWPAADPGEIVEVFFDGKFLIRTGDSTLLVTEAEGYLITESDVEGRVGTAGAARKVWNNLPE